MILIILLFLLGLLVNETRSRPCFNCTTDVCHMYLLNNRNNTGCGQVGEETRYILSESVIDYDQYLGLKVKLVQDSRNLVLYECPDNSKLSMYPLNNYRAIKTNENPIVLHYDEIGFYKMDKGFQKCLSDFCYSLQDIRTFNFRFVCKNDYIKFLDFEFSKTVTHPCLQSITFASISSANLTDINTSMFFNYAVRIVSLKIRTTNQLPFARCNLFRHITYLRLLHIPFTTQNHAVCFFMHNSRLIRVSNNSTRVWNMCGAGYEFVAGMTPDDEFETVISPLGNQSEIDIRVSNGDGDGRGHGHDSDFVTFLKYALFLISPLIICVTCFTSVYFAVKLIQKKQPVRMSAPSLPVSENVSDYGFFFPISNSPYNTITESTL